MKILRLIMVNLLLLLMFCGSCYGQKYKSSRKNSTYKRRVSGNGFRLASTSMYFSGENEAWISLNLFEGGFGYGLGYARYISPVSAIEFIAHHESKAFEDNRVSLTGIGVGPTYSLMNLSNVLLFFCLWWI